jgi:hypothetical protein
MGTTVVPPSQTLTISSLMSRGLFHNRMIPAFTSLDLARISQELESFAAADLVKRNGKPFVDF